MTVQGPHRADGVLPSPAAPATDGVEDAQSSVEAPQGRTAESPPPNLVDAPARSTALENVPQGRAGGSGPALEDPQLRDFEAQLRDLAVRIGRLEGAAASDEQFRPHLAQARTQLRDVRGSMLSALAPRIEAARRQLQAWNLPSHFHDAATTQPETLVRLVPILRAWTKKHGAPPHRIPTRDLGLLYNVAHTSDSSTIQPMLTALQEAPAHLVDDPALLGQLPADLTSSGLRRAESLSKSVDYVATPADVEMLGQLSNREFRDLERTWKDLHRKAHFRPKREFNAVHTLSNALGHVEAKVLVRGAEALHGVTGAPLDVPDLFAASILGQDRPGPRERLLALLARSQPEPGRTGHLATLATRAPVTPGELGAIDGAVERLGHRLEERELVNLVDALRSGRSLDELVPAGITQASGQHQIPLKDVHVWATRDFAPFQDGERDALVEELTQTIRPGRPRADAALPSESFADAALTDGELLKLQHIMTSLQQPGFRQRITAHIAQDLGTHTGEGLASIHPSADPAALEWRILPTAGGSNQHAEVPPRPALEPLQTLALAHLHATEAEGNASHAGPSLFDLVFADGIHQDWLVVTHLGEGQFNVDFYTASGAVVDLGDYP